MNEKPRALVTGANGFVGSHLVEGLLHKGYRVRCLVRRTSNLQWLSGLEVEYVYGDIAEKASLISAVRNVDLVFHTAGLTKAKSREEYFRANAGGTRNLVEACLEENPRLQRFIYISSQAAVGPGHSERPLNETAPCRPITHYGESKMEGEKIVSNYSAQLPITIIRPPAVYGPRDTDVLAFFQVVNKGFRISFGRGESLLSLVCVNDLVDGIILVAENPIASGQTYFIADDRVYTWKRAFEIIAKSLEKRTVPLRIPKSLVFALAFLSESLSRLLGRTAVFNTQKAKEITSRYWGLDVSKAKTDLGFAPRYDLQRGAVETVKWYKEKGWL
ncbi:MAG: NAD-dependent epimerase/dehydratase family protein [Candidatus Zixiibacteriota bacterium]